MQPAADPNPVDRFDVRPQAGPQSAFLQSRADVVIYGGAAGGGKTFGLLLDAWRGAKTAGYKAVVFRRETPSITNPGSIWDEANGLYPLLDGVPNVSALSFKFPAGGRIKFSHLEQESDLEHWRGSQLAWIGFEELTEFTMRQFVFMLSRNRTASAVVPRVRATCNPDPDSWVADFIEWWIDQETGLPIPERAGVHRYFVRDGDAIVWGDTPDELLRTRPHLPAEAPKSVTFIPAKLTDNPALMKANPEYLANLLAQSRVDQERLLHGNWKVRATGGRFQLEWFGRYADIGDAWRMLGRGEVVRKDNCLHFLTVDPAASEKSSADWTVICTWAVTPRNDLILADVDRFQMQIPDIPPRVLAAYQNSPVKPAFAAIEAVYSNTAVYQHCQRLPMVVQRLEPHGLDKIVRATPAILFVQSGRMWIPERGPGSPQWLQPFVRELCNFTGDPKLDSNDDMVDCVSYSVQCLTSPGMRPGMRPVNLDNRRFNRTAPFQARRPVG